MNFDSIYPELGKLIGQRRKQLNLTQEKLAPMVGMSRASLANVERGRQKVLVHQLLALAHALDMQPANLLPSVAKAGERPAGVKLPTGLSQIQRQQISRLLAGDANQELKEEDNAKSNKR